jgi:Protein of unknown function (DUF1580)
VQKALQARLAIAIVSLAGATVRNVERVRHGSTSRHVSTPKQKATDSQNVAAHVSVRVLGGISMIDLSAEQIITFAQAAETLSKKGHTVNPSTVWRWASRGIRTKDGTLVKLDAARLGGRWITSAQAIQKFSNALTGTTTPAADSRATRTPGRRRLASERAAKRLAASGI